MIVESIPVLKMKKQHYSLSRIIAIVTFICLTGSYTLQAQQIKGKAIYKTLRKIDLKINDNDENAALKKQLYEQLKKQNQKEYTLTFSNDESFYKLNENLDSPSPATASTGIQIKISGNTDLLYFNHKEKRYVTETEIFGKKFLIKDSLTYKDWNITKENKNIGEYLCFKATRTEDYTSNTFDSETNQLKEETKTKTITVWFTPLIPIQAGPDTYNGLPGLILEVNDGNLTVVCSKIILNPKEGITILEPDKGKIVTQEKFDTILDKKNKEMMEQFQSNRNGKKGNSVFIKMGG